MEMVNNIMVHGVDRIEIRNKVADDGSLEWTEIKLLGPRGEFTVHTFTDCEDLCEVLYLRTVRDLTDG